MGMGERGQAEFFATAKNERLTDDQQTIRKYCKLQKTGRSIVVVHKAGGLVVRVRFPAARHTRLSASRRIAQFFQQTTFLRLERADGRKRALARNLVANIAIL